MNESIGDETVPEHDVSDDMLERAAIQRARTPNPTVPGGIICIPFENLSDVR